MKTSMARFPFHKSLESFDFKFQPSIDPKVVKELATGRFIADSDNILLLGPPGIGKTHLAVGLGPKACAMGHRTAFTTAAGLVTTLTRAHQENRLEEKGGQVFGDQVLATAILDRLLHHSTIVNIKGEATQISALRQPANSSSGCQRFASCMGVTNRRSAVTASA
jgi:DNA replication protein DnaC